VYGYLSLSLSLSLSLFLSLCVWKCKVDIRLLAADGMELKAPDGELGERLDQFMSSSAILRIAIHEARGLPTHLRDYYVKYMVYIVMYVYYIMLYNTYILFIIGLLCQVHGIYCNICILYYVI
jgi:hypothetical protein